MKVIKPVFKVLIVEDNLINATVLQDALQEFGNIITIIAHSSEQALQASPNEFDLIFLDIQMPPGINGNELCKLLRNYILDKDIPIICYSSISEKNEHECLEAGMNDFLPKPFISADLERILECWLPQFKLGAP